MLLYEVIMENILCHDQGHPLVLKWNSATSGLLDFLLQDTQNVPWFSGHGKKTTSAMASRHSGTDLMGAQCHDKSIQLWFHSRLTIGGYSSSKKYDHLIRVQTEIICFATYTYYYTTHSTWKDGKKPFFLTLLWGVSQGNSLECYSSFWPKRRRRRLENLFFLP